MIPRLFPKLPWMYALDLHANGRLYFSFFFYRFVSLTCSIWQSFHSQNNNNINTNASSLPLKFIGVISRRKALYMIIYLFFVRGEKYKKKKLKAQNVESAETFFSWDYLCSLLTNTGVEAFSPIYPSQLLSLSFFYSITKYTEKTFHNWYVRAVAK